MQVGIVESFFAVFLK